MEAIANTNHQVLWYMELIELIAYVDEEVA